MALFWLPRHSKGTLGSSDQTVNDNTVRTVFRTDRLLPATAASGKHYVKTIGEATNMYCNKHIQYPRIYLTEVLSLNDPRSESSIFDAAKSKELVVLLDKGVYEVVLKDDVPKGSNILGGRFVLATKNKGTEKELYKARFVVQGNQDREKSRIVHPATNLRFSSIRVLTCIAAIFAYMVSGYLSGLPTVV